MCAGVADQRDRAEHRRRRMKRIAPRTDEGPLHDGRLAMARRTTRATPPHTPIRDCLPAGGSRCEHGPGGPYMTGAGTNRGSAVPAPIFEGES